MSLSSALTRLKNLIASSPKTGQTVMVTGHRPSKIGGYDVLAPQRVRIRNHMHEQLMRLHPTMCISGMALGIDQDFAQVCIDIGCPFEAFIPVEGQDRIWPESSRIYYRELLSKAKTIVNCGKDLGARQDDIPFMMQHRNECMVNNSQIVLAYWDGSKGGTANCVRYAKTIPQVTVHIFDPGRI